MIRGSAVRHVVPGPTAHPDRGQRLEAALQGRNPQHEGQSRDCKEGDRLPNPTGAEEREPTAGGSAYPEPDDEYHPRGW